MCTLKQKELTPDAVLEMGDHVCSDCPDAAGCKRYLQWLRLNPVTLSNPKGNSNYRELTIYDRPFYRTNKEEIFW